MKSPIHSSATSTGPAFTFIIAVGVIFGCSGTEGSGSAVGGSSSSGGSSSGGSSGSSGSSGGSSGSSGGSSSAPASGGASPSGGTTGVSSATGGRTNIGGAATGGSVIATGGTIVVSGGAATGGKSTTGGSATGGKSTTGGSATGGKSTTGGTSTAGSSAGGQSATGGTSAVGGGTSTGGPSSSTELCTRWNADRTDMTETGWTGDTSTCTAGDMSATSRANALRLVNLYRWIAGLPAVTTSDQHNQDDQACALMMAANGTLNHTPPTTWTCYTANGATAAGSSNISGAGAVLSVASYMVDPGNATTLGHRRWCLSNSLGPIGIGSTGQNGYSCMWTLNGTGNAGKQWMSWPPPGFFPIQAATDNWNRTLDTTGWSLQSDSINLANAAVTVTLNGTTMPVTVAQLGANYGSRYAISFIPSGWTMAAGNTYHVSITGISTPITYDVQVVSC